MTVDSQRVNLTRHLHTGQVTDSGAYASWAGSFGEDAQEEYVRFQWGLGTSEGNDDLFQFEDVGTADSATVGNLDLGEFVMTPCWLSVRGWKKDGRCVELFAKASPATKGNPCVHRRLWVGDGYVAINKGESIQRFFEKAEEADEDVSALFASWALQHFPLSGISQLFCGL
jgi:hypothetical protein